MVGTRRDPSLARLPLLVVFASLPSLAAPSLHAEEGRLELTWQGRPRSCRLVLPPRAASRPVPLVMALHGTGQRGRDMARLLRDDFDRLALRDGVIVAYPDSVSPRWNDGRRAEGLSNRSVDDVGFLTALADEIARRHGAARRFAVAGFSNGGAMACRLAVERPERLVAVAAVAALMPRDLAATATPGAPVPALFFLGTKDPYLAWGGGPHGGDGSPLVSKRDQVALFVGRNRSRPVPEIAWLPDLSQDGCRVRREIYAPGDDGAAAVVFHGVIGGGHTWPGGHPYMSAPRMGALCRDLSATRIIWSFFRAGGRRPPRAGGRRARTR